MEAAAPDVREDADRVSEENGQGSTDRQARRAADSLLLRVSRQGGAPVALLVITTLVLAAAQLALPYVFGRTLDTLIQRESADTWLLATGLLVALLVLVDALDDLVSGAAIARSTAWLRHTLLRHVLAVGPGPRDRAEQGGLSSRLVANAADAGRVAPDLVRAGISILPSVGGTVALALIDPLLCLTFLAGMPIFLLVLRTFARDASGQASRYLETQGTIASRLVEALSGSRTIAAAGTQERETERILRPLGELHRHGIGMWRAQTRITAQDAVLISLLEIAVLAVAGALLAADRITPGQMVAAGQYVVLAATLSAAVGFIDRLVRCRAAAQRINEVLEQACGSVRTGEAPCRQRAARVSRRKRPQRGSAGPARSGPVAAGGAAWPRWSARAARASHSLRRWPGGSSIPTRETSCSTACRSESSATLSCGAPSATASSDRC